MIVIRAMIVVGMLTAAAAAAAGPDRDLGASVRADIDEQVIDMNPDYRDRPVTGTSGRRAADAIIRYQTGQLKPLFRTNGKTELGSQGGAGDAPTVSIPLISTGSPNR